MVELPTGTVTLLFSDIEGSTLLLSRLGRAYADVLGTHRRLLRDAWSTHGGTELGTAGDSFAVAFTTAEDAVAAAALAQRGLATYPWPVDEAVRVRMGIHTGSPQVRDGDYVGMDVHRAARIGAAAHGGQVVLSQATAKLVQDRLPAGVQIRDLGAHRLKDIAIGERLFQLVVDGLRADFPPLKSLGAASSLPRPGTALVGRDGELADLESTLASAETRLLTLTGTGGAGKTRLAIEVARRLIPRFSDGVYFVPLAAVTTADVMWTSIAEALDVPAEARLPSGLFAHVAHRTVLVVLDNLEQVEGADAVLAELLRESSDAVFVVTSRRPLNLTSEVQHVVPPLQLPAGAVLEQVQRSGAVQLFRARARAVNSDFAVTSENAAAVSAVCQRLDGLPLAIELAAARTKIMTPQALLSRLDHALDLRATGVDRPCRQQTLRDAVAWSYRLLDPAQQTFFRFFGVFAGGADLDAVTTLSKAVGSPVEADPLDMVAALVDASLATVDESPDGEPRFGMLATIRAYAWEQLEASEELHVVRDRYVHHYMGLAERWSRLLNGARHVEARARLETELDNFRAVLGWTLAPEQEGASVVDGGAQLALRVCLTLGDFWRANGYIPEMQRWLARAIDQSGGSDGPELARSLALLATALRVAGDTDGAEERAIASVGMWRRMGDSSRLSAPLTELAYVEIDRGRPAAARSLYEEAVTAARGGNDKVQLVRVLGNFALLEHYEHNYPRAVELHTEVVTLAEQVGSPAIVITARHNLACTLRGMGRVAEAKRDMRALIPLALDLNEPDLLMVLAEDYAAALAQLGEHRLALRLWGAADATHERLATPRSRVQQADIAAAIAEARAALPSATWDDEYRAGRHTAIEEALVHAGTADADRDGPVTDPQTARALAEGPTS